MGGRNPVSQAANASGREQPAGSRELELLKAVVCLYRAHWHSYAPAFRDALAGFAVIGSLGFAFGDLEDWQFIAAGAFEVLLVNVMTWIIVAVCWIQFLRKNGDL